MTASFRSAPGGPARPDPRRPIASALPLPRQHVQTIDQSHERCAAWGLSRIERPDPSPLRRSDLAVVRERNQRLHSHAAPVMEMLFEQIVETQSMVVLCDATGTIIHSIGDDDFLARASKVALQPGVDWSEPSKGTNAIGTALMNEAPTLVHADEHFMHANHFLTCSAAPILDPRGNLLGVLDVTGDRHSYHQHTMALVKMSARMIENHWLSDDHRDVMRLHFHSRVEFIGTLMEGIVAISADGRLVGANRGALDQLGCSGAALRLHTVQSLFGTTVSSLVDRFRTPLALPMALTLANGRQFQAHARFDWPVWHSVAEAAAASAPFPDASPTAALAPAELRRREGCGLAALATGDAQMEAAIARLRRVLERDMPILILGDTGTGKELLARAFHHDSSRARQPFVAVRCAGVPVARLEAELFGQDDGSGPPGKIMQAQGGTLFLDDVGDLPPSAQARLLRVLQEGRLMAAGGTAAPLDLALVCASRHGLQERVASGQFRDDLFHRLEGLAVRLPSLRERSDLPALVQRVLADEAPGRALRLSTELGGLFARYRWPGNLRQLRNVLRTAVAMSAGDSSVITREHLSSDFLEDVLAPSAADAGAGARLAEAETPTAGRPQDAASHGGTAAGGQQPGASLEAVELGAIRAALQAEGGNISRAARRLGISRNTVYRKLGRAGGR